MLQFFLVVSLFLLQLLLCGCRGIDFNNPTWWSPLEVPQLEDKLEYDAEGRPINIVWVENYEIDPVCDHGEVERLLREISVSIEDK